MSWIAIKLGCNKYHPQILHIASTEREIYNAIFNKFIDVNVFDVYKYSDGHLVDPESDEYYDWIPIIEPGQKTYFVFDVPDKDIKCCKTYTIAVVGPLDYINVQELLTSIEVI